MTGVSRIYGDPLSIQQFPSVIGASIGIRLWRKWAAVTCLEERVKIGGKNVSPAAHESCWQFAATDAMEVPTPDGGDVYFCQSGGMRHGIAGFS